MVNPWEPDHSVPSYLFTSQLTNGWEILYFSGEQKLANYNITSLSIL